MAQQLRSFDAVGEEHGRVFDIEIAALPGSSPDTALARFILRSARKTRLITNAAVCRNHVRDSGTGRAARIQVGLSHQMRGLVTAPALPL